MLQFEKMTVKAQEALRNAQGIAAQHQNQQIEPLHLLAALVAQVPGKKPSQGQAKECEDDDDDSSK